MLVQQVAQHVIGDEQRSGGKAGRCDGEGDGGELGPSAGNEPNNGGAWPSRLDPSRLGHDIIFCRDAGYPRRPHAIPDYL